MERQVAVPGLRGHGAQFQQAALSFCSLDFAQADERVMQLGHVCSWSKALLEGMRART